MRGGRLCAQQGCYSPGHQVLQHFRRQRWRAEAARLRDCESVAARRWIRSLDDRWPAADDPRVREP